MVYCQELSLAFLYMAALDLGIGAPDNPIFAVTNISS
jgi:hypothetical protein